jgi:hypothetical protein
MGGRGVSIPRDSSRTRNWTVPADINDLKKPYRIDAAFNKLPPPSGWANAWHDQKAFGRRALEVAIVSASDVGFDDPRTGLTDCRSIVKLADQAKQRLDILLGHLGPNVRHLESHLRALAIAGPLKILRAGAGGAVDEPRERRTQAKRDAQTLVGASESLGRIIADAAEKARRIKLHTQNPGNPAKTEFVGRLAEAWSCLKGRRPPASMEPRTNASCGWPLRHGRMRIVCGLSPRRTLRARCRPREGG